MLLSIIRINYYVDMSQTYCDVTTRQQALELMKISF